MRKSITHIHLLLNALHDEKEIFFTRDFKIGFDLMMGEWFSVKFILLFLLKIQLGSFKTEVISIAS